MLHYEAIDTKTLELLKELCKAEIFSEMRLTGGTGLALQIGHRKSIDLDFFGPITADEIHISRQLLELGSVSILKKSENIQVFLVDGIKIDLVNYPYPWIEEALVLDELRIAGMKDIAAMKLAAITGRGTKKDFIDIYFLLKKYTLKEILGWYNTKYHDGSEFLVLKSLTYFVDAEEDENPVMIQAVKWNDAKTVIKNIVEKYLKSI